MNVDREAAILDILARIDLALDRRDRRAFFHFCRILRALKRSQ
ncbi:IDEAL domain-containing protein [Prauserella endophytica]|nr:IDEAL domain-containing protein [Prauserella endophytica]